MQSIQGHQHSPERNCFLKPPSNSTFQVALITEPAMDSWLGDKLFVSYGTYQFWIFIFYLTVDLNWYHKNDQDGANDNIPKIKWFWNLQIFAQDYFMIQNKLTGPKLVKKMCMLLLARKVDNNFLKKKCNSNF